MCVITVFIVQNMAQADNTSSKENDDEENRKLYVECLGQLVGITFKPGTELKEVLEVPRKQYEVDKAQIDPYIIRNISTENCKSCYFFIKRLK